MADLMETAREFADALVANDMGALMMAFTPVGIGKALAMQAESESSPEGSTSIDVQDQGNGLVHITFKGDDGEGTIFTQWVEQDAVWKVDDMGMVDG